jgi:sugar-specific transcriptional regulator TrmB
MDKRFEVLGFTDNEAKVYRGFLKNPRNSAAKISRILKMDKSSCYKAVEILINKGLLLRDGWKKGAIYSAANPEILNDLYNAKRTELENQKSPISSLIESLKFDQTDNRSTYISIDKGVEGLKLRMSEGLENKEKLIRENFNYHPIFRDPEYIKFVKKHAIERVKKKIHIRELQSKKDRKNGIEAYQEIMLELRKYLKEQRDLPESFKDNNSYRIWDDTVMILSSDANGEFIVLTIKDKYLVTLLKSLFDFVWEHSTPVRGK